MSADCGMGEGRPETCAAEAQSGPHWSPSTLRLLLSHSEPRYWIVFVWKQTADVYLGMSTISVHLSNADVETLHSSRTRMPSHNHLEDSLCTVGVRG